MRSKPFLAIGTHHNAQIGNAKFLQTVEFAAQQFAIAPFALRGKYGGIPHIGAYETIRLAVEHKLAVLHGHKTIVATR